MKVGVIVLASLVSLSQAKAPHQRHATALSASRIIDKIPEPRLARRQKLIPGLVSAALGDTSTPVLPASTIAEPPGQPKASIVVSVPPVVKASGTSRDKLVTTGLLTNTARPSVVPLPSMARGGPVPSETLVSTMLSVPLPSSASLPTDLSTPALANSTALRPSASPSSTSTFTVTADAATITSDPNGGNAVSTVVVQVTRAAPTPTLGSLSNSISAGGRVSIAGGVAVLSWIGLILI